VGTAHQGLQAGSYYPSSHLAPFRARYLRMDLKKPLIIFVVGYLVVSVWWIGTPYIKNAIFQNELDNIARTLSVDGTVQRARRQVLEAVRQNEIPAQEKDFTIVRDQATRQAFVGVKYTVAVSTPFNLYTHNWHFSPSAEYGLQKIPQPSQ